MNLAFYTYFYGSNDNKAFRIPTLPSLKYDCYFYTNNLTMVNNLSGSKWIVIYDDKPILDDPIVSCMTGKHIKTCPHEYKDLQKYDYLCFLDTKVGHVNETFVENFITKFFIEGDYALLLREHPFVKNNVWNEYVECMIQYRYTLEKDKYINYINEQISNGLSETTDKHCACGFLIRNMKHRKIKAINTTWYEHIQKCGIQDQISFFFAKQFFKDFIFPFKENPYY